MRYADIKQFPDPKYQVSMPWAILDEWLDGFARDAFVVNLSPTYQRDYVWTPEQKTADTQIPAARRTNRAGHLPELRDVGFSQRLAERAGDRGRQAAARGGAGMSA